MYMAGELFNFCESIWHSFHSIITNALVACIQIFEPTGRGRGGCYLANLVCYFGCDFERSLPSNRTAILIG